MCEHKFVNLYYQKRETKSKVVWTKVGYKLCNKCFSIYTFKQVAQLNQVSEEAEKEAEDLINAPRTD